MFAVNFQKRAQDSTGSNSSAAGPSPLSSYHSCPSVDSARSQEVKFRSIQSSFDSIKEIPKKRQSLSNKSGLVFPASKTLKKLKKGKFADTIREGEVNLHFKASWAHFLIHTGAAVYMAGVLEYLTAEILECSGSYTREMKRKRISPRHINLAIRADKELDDFLKDVTIADGKPISGLVFQVALIDWSISRWSFSILPRWVVAEEDSKEFEQEFSCNWKLGEVLEILNAIFYMF